MMHLAASDHKCTEYFLSIRDRPDRAAIRVEWIATAIAKPLCAETQKDGETVHNALFDRGFREG